MDRVYELARHRHRVSVGHETLAMLLALAWCVLLVLDSLFAPAWPRPLWVALLVWVVVAVILVSGGFLGERLERAWQRVDDTQRRTLAQMLCLMGAIAALEGWVLARSVLSSWSLSRTLWNAGTGILAFAVVAGFVLRWIRQGRSWAPVSNAWLVIQGMLLVSMFVLALVQLSVGW